MESRIIIDATNATMGRLASYAAKQALFGREIIIVNSEKAIVTGAKRVILTKYGDKRKKGGTSLRGPVYYRAPERMIKMAIRGMLPNHRTGKGKEALRRVMCYRGIPEEYKNEKMIKAGKEKKTKYLTVKEISERI